MGVSRVTKSRECYHIQPAVPSVHCSVNLNKMRGFCMLAVLCLVEVSVADKRVLVLLENLAVKETHSIYFKNMADAGFDLTFKGADDATLDIKKFGEFLYDHLVVFAPTVEEFGGNLNMETITDFIDGGGNLLIAGNSNLGDVLREIASEVGFEADEEGTTVIDHLSYDTKDEGKHNLVIADSKNLIKSDKITAGVSTPLLYRGVGLLLDQENPLVLEILTRLLLVSQPLSYTVVWVSYLTKRTPWCWKSSPAAPPPTATTQTCPSRSSHTQWGSRLSSLLVFRQGIMLEWSLLDLLSSSLMNSSTMKLNQWVGLRLLLGMKLLPRL